MSFYNFSNKVKVVAGENAVRELANQMTLLGAKNILLISDQNLKRLGYVKTVKDIIGTNSRLRINAVYLNIKNGASTANINEAYALFRDNSCDSIIALGGDGTINVAKVLTLMLATKTKSLTSIYGSNSARKQENVPFGVVATTIGASRGVGKTAFIRDEDTGARREFITDLMQPNFCILDPVFTYSLEPSKIALNVIEMLVNCIELYISKLRNPISKSYSLYAVGLLKDLLNRLESSKDVTDEMRFTLQEVAAIAGSALSSSAGGMSLALANAISDVSHVDRNEALAVIFPAFLNYYKDVRKDTYEQILQYGYTREQFIEIDKDKRADVFVESCINLLENVMNKYGIPTNLTDLKVSEDDFVEIAARASLDSALLDSPKWFEKGDLVNILKECL